MSAAQRIVCPSCGSADVREREPRRYACSHCETQFVLGATGVASTSPPAQKRGAIVVAVAGVAVIGAGAGAWLLFSSPEPSRGMSSANVPRSVAMPVSSKSAVVPEEKPKVELGRIQKGRTRIGGEFWLVDYANAGKVAIERPAVTASLFDEAGKRVGEQSGYAVIEELAPGASTTILILLSNPPAYTREEIAANEPRPLRRGSAQVPITVVEHSVTHDSTVTKSIIGTVRNDARDPARFIKVLALGRDANGAVVSHATGYVTSKTLQPGESTGFKISIGTFELGDPASWELLAAGRL